MPKRRHSVAPVDLLAFGVGATGIADRYLVDPRVGLGQQRRDLGLEAEAVRGQLRRHRTRELTADRLVAGLHVGEVEIRQHVAVHRQQAVAHRMPVIQDAMRSAEEARSETGVGLSVDERLEEHRPIGGIVFEVRVPRSEERRVGEEWRTPWSAYHY